MTRSPRPQKENRSPHPPLVSGSPACFHRSRPLADHSDGTKKVAKTPQNPLFEKKSKTFGIGMSFLFGQMNLPNHQVVIFPPSRT